MHPILLRITPLTYTLLTISLLVFGLSIATLTLESRFIHVFRDLQVQIPGSNLVEWAFVSLEPNNLDTGPTIAILVTGACGVVSGVTVMGWVGCIWGGVRETTTRLLGLVTVSMLMINSGASIALMTYVLITQNGMQLPERFRLWGTTTFTQEYYICTAFPSQIPDAEEAIYGFGACDVAKTARYMFISVASTSVLLALFGSIQAWRSGAIMMIMHPGQRVEKLPKTVQMSARIECPSEVHIPQMIRGPKDTRQPIDHMPLVAPVPDFVTYYEEEIQRVEDAEYPTDRKAPVRTSQYGYYSRL